MQIDKLNGALVERGENLLDEIPVAYIELDMNGQMTFANRAACQLQQQTEAELLGCTPWQFMSTKEVAKSVDQFAQMMLPGADTTPVRRSFYTASGQFSTHELHFNRMQDERGDIIGLRVGMFDVTELQVACEEAQEARSWLENILTSLPEAMIVTDALGFVRFINPAAENLSGWRSSEIIGQTIEQRLPILFYCAISERPLSFHEALDGPCKGTAVVLNRGGENIHIEIAASPLLDKERRCTTGVVSTWRRL